MSPKDASKKGGAVSTADSPGKARAVRAAHRARRKSIDAQVAALPVPEGFRCLDHFLDSIAEFTAQRPGTRRQLAEYLWPKKPASTRSSELSRKLKTNRKPRRYPTAGEVAAMHLWLISQRK